MLDQKLLKTLGLLRKCRMVLRLMVAFMDRAHPSMGCILLRTKLQNTYEEISRLQLQAAELMIQFNKDLEVLIDTY